MMKTSEMQSYINLRHVAANYINIRGSTNEQQAIVNLMVHIKELARYHPQWPKYQFLVQRLGDSVMYQYDQEGVLTETEGYIRRVQKEYKYPAVDRMVNVLKQEILKAKLDITREVTDLTGDRTLVVYQSKRKEPEAKIEPEVVKHTKLDELVEAIESKETKDVTTKETKDVVVSKPLKAFARGTNDFIATLECVTSDTSYNFTLSTNDEDSKGDEGFHVWPCNGMKQLRSMIKVSHLNFTGSTLQLPKSLFKGIVLLILKTKNPLHSVFPPMFIVDLAKTLPKYTFSYKYRGQDVAIAKSHYNKYLKCVKNLSFATDLFKKNDSESYAEIVNQLKSWLASNSENFSKGAEPPLTPVV